MDLRVIDKSDTELSIEVAGEDHTFMNVIKGALLETEGVTAATYDVNPEQSGGQTDPVLTIKTETDVDALDALEDGTDRVIEKTDDLTEAFESAA
ncbi:DNA-directed RNA polymerase subunit L [Haloarcula sediminis]|uniref:DNA-directed RNA polymerase subunit L n=1 Tax=Haloarcula sediminis TaxID=3111777 RepID=UPI002D7970BF|nr:DNA-directed RNA polymerase subunit L [Haloarcula sp. CK38]